MTESRGSVLIVEDDDTLRQIVGRHLRGKGFDIAEAASVEAATALLDGGLRPNVVLLDVNLPGDTGWDLLRGAALTASGPAVLITSAGAVSPKRLAEFGCAGWLPKPYPLETLVDTLDRLIADGKASAAQ